MWSSVVGEAGAAAAVDAEGEVDVGHDAVTRVWPANETSSPVPLGTQTAVLSWSTSGMPPEVTRRAATTQLALTHGRGAVRQHEGAAGDDVRRGLADGGRAREQDAGERCRRLRLPPVHARHRCGLGERGGGHQITSSAPLLTETFGPVSLMVAPMPLVISIPGGAHRHLRALGSLEGDATDARGVVEGDAVPGRRDQQDLLVRRRQQHRRDLGRRAPPAPDPDRGSRGRRARTRSRLRLRRSAARKARPGRRRTGRTASPSRSLSPKTSGTLALIRMVISGSLMSLTTPRYFPQNLSGHGTTAGVSEPVPSRLSPKRWV